jgi:hypothetical protein
MRVKKLRYDWRKWLHTIDIRNLIFIGRYRRYWSSAERTFRFENLLLLIDRGFLSLLRSSELDRRHPFSFKPSL